MPTTIMSWPVKRLAIARLQGYADGTEPVPPGCEMLVATRDRPVQVDYMAPPEPDRISIFGGPLRSVLSEDTAESADLLTETTTVEIKVRCFEPGDDVAGVDRTLGDMCQAVVTGLLWKPLNPNVRFWLDQIRQDGGGYSPSPEPAVVMSASLFFAAEVVAYGN
jgi:hypothetical protein